MEAENQEISKENYQETMKEKNKEKIVIIDKSRKGSRLFAEKTKEDKPLVNILMKLKKIFSLMILIRLGYLIIISQKITLQRS